MVARKSLGRLIVAQICLLTLMTTLYEDHIVHNLKKLVEQPLEVILLLIITKFSLY